MLGVVRLHDCCAAGDQVGYGGSARAGPAMMTRRQVRSARAGLADEGAGADELAKQRLTHAVRSSARVKATTTEDMLQALLNP
jgi:hypothetical protein